MAHKKSRTRSAWKARYLAYKTDGRQAKNKSKRLLRHMKNHPNDLQSSAIKKEPVNYKRKKPYTPMEELVRRINSVDKPSRR